jgi:hypothetical protein
VSPARLSVSERSPTEGGDREASDFDPITASPDDLTLLYRKSDIEIGCGIFRSTKQDHS